MLYVELDDAAGTMVKRMMVPVVSGFSWNNIALDEKDVSEGSYTLRAYTNWMRNFGEDYIFKKNIYISASNSSSTLVKAEFKLDSIAGKNNVQSTLRFTDLSNKDPAPAEKDMQLKLVNGNNRMQFI